MPASFPPFSDCTHNGVGVPLSQVAARFAIHIFGMVLVALRSAVDRSEALGLAAEL
jgi:hypothetical protein